VPNVEVSSSDAPSRNGHWQTTALLTSAWAAGLQAAAKKSETALAVEVASEPEPVFEVSSEMLAAFNDEDPICTSTSDELVELLSLREAAAALAQETPTSQFGIHARNQASELDLGN
jgi:hypothetical protein